MINKILNTAFALLIVSQLEARPRCDDLFGEFSLKGEYLFWKLEDSPAIIPLVVEGPAYLPLLDGSKTSVALGGRDTNNHLRSGGRLTAAYRSPYEIGAEISCFFINSGCKHRSTVSLGLPISRYLAVPYFDVLTFTENSYSLANSDPALDGGAYSGYASLFVENAMQGVDLNGLASIYENVCIKIEFLTGFRYWSFQEKATFFTSNPYLAEPADVFQTTDRFCAGNDFYGGQLGVKFYYLLDRLYATCQLKAAFGDNCSTLRIDGKCITNDFNPLPFTGVPKAFPGGLFALPTNEGKHSYNVFCIIPEVNLNVGYQLMKCLRIELGYTFLYASRVLFATRQLNRSLNPTQSAAIAYTPTPQLTGAPAPEPLFKTSSLWIQGLNVGLEFVY